MYTYIHVCACVCVYIHMNMYMHMSPFCIRQGRTCGWENEVIRHMSVMQYEALHFFFSFVFLHTSEPLLCNTVRILPLKEQSLTSLLFFLDSWVPFLITLCTVYSLFFFVWLSNFYSIVLKNIQNQVSYPTWRLKIVQNTIASHHCSKYSLYILVTGSLRSKTKILTSSPWDLVSLTHYTPYNELTRTAETVIFQV